MNVVVIVVSLQIHPLLPHCLSKCIWILLLIVLLVVVDIEVIDNSEEAKENLGLEPNTGPKTLPIPLLAFHIIC